MMSIRSSLTTFLHRKDSPLAQFVKYVFCGGTAVVVDTMTFYLLAWLVFPCMRAGDPIARLIEWVGFEAPVATEDEIRRNFMLIKGVCFIVSNSVVYLLNVLFVFQSGKHKRILEILMFFGASLFQFVFIWLGRVLITEYGWHVTYSNIAMLVIGVVVNYFVRKFVIFKW